MFRIFQAMAAFFKIVGNRSFAAQVRELRSGISEEPVAPEVAQESTDAAEDFGAIALMRALQRDARLVDFLKEDISSFSDDQVGAAVRDIHAKSAEVLERFFAIAPLRDESEGEQVEVPAEFDSGLFTLIGSVAGSGPWRGALAHPGWVASKNEVPSYSGSAEAGRVIAPSEVELA